MVHRPALSDSVLLLAFEHLRESSLLSHDPSYNSITRTRPVAGEWCDEHIFDREMKEYSNESALECLSRTIT